MKKLLIVLLTIAMVLGMSGAVFATENGNGDQTTDWTKVTINKNITLTNTGTVNPAETFNFTIGAGSGVRDGVDIEAPDFTPNTFTINVDKGEVTGTADINLPTFTGVGVYTYPITEATGNTAGMTYDNVAKSLVVTVINNPNGEGFIRLVTIAGQDGEKVDSFENTFSAGDLVISKEVTGNMGDKERYFKVTVTFAGNNVRDAISVEGGSNSSNPATVSVGTPADFLIKHDETIIFSNIPYGVTYEVVEEDYTDDGYDTATYVASDKEGETSKIDSGEETVVITNNKGIVPEVGVNLDNLPYVLTLVMALGGLVVFVLRKRIFN